MVLNSLQGSSIEIRKHKHIELFNRMLQCWHYGTNIIQDVNYILIINSNIQSFYIDKEESFIYQYEHQATFN